MPRPAQWLTYLNPLRYYLIILRGSSSRGSAPRAVAQMAALLLLGGSTLAIATRRFRKTLS